MSQTSLVFFYLLAGFVVFVVAKGELPAYSKVFVG